MGRSPRGGSGLAQQGAGEGEEAGPAAAASRHGAVSASGAREGHAPPHCVVVGSVSEELVSMSSTQSRILFSLIVSLKICSEHASGAGRMQTNAWRERQDAIPHQAATPAQSALGARARKSPR